MALFNLFRSPIKRAAKQAPEITAGVVNTGVDVYSFPGTPEEYFAQVLTRNFPGYEIRRNVAFSDLYDPFGAIRSAAQVPGYTFKTNFEKSVAYDMLRDSHPRMTFVVYRYCEPLIAILLTPKADYDNPDKWLVANRMGLALRQKNIAFQRYYKEFRNDEAYIRQRIQEDLG